MATTVDLGKVRPVWKGAWSANTAYEVHDMVKHDVDSYICTTGHTSGSTFSATNWDYLSQGAQIPDQSGQTGKVLKTDGSSLSWGASDDASALTQGTLPVARMPSGSVLKVQSVQDQVRRDIGNRNRNPYHYTQLNMTFNRTNTSGKLLIELQISLAHYNHCGATVQYSYDNSSWTPVTVPGYSGAAQNWGSNLNKYALMGWLHNDSGDPNYSDTATSTVLFTPTSGQSTVYFRCYCWMENSSETMVLNGTRNNANEHGTVHPSGLTVMEIS